MSAPRHPLEILAAPYTPFHADGSLDLAGVEPHAAHLLRNGIRAVFLNGTTGECHSLSVAERRRLAERWTEVARGTGLRIVVHVGTNALVDAVELARHAAALGAAGVSAMSPSYFRPRSVEDLVGCAAMVAAAAPETPFYLYDIPSMTGVHLPMPEFLARARDRIPNLAGLKYSNPDLMSFQLLLDADGGRWDIPWGTDEALLAALALGARTAVGSTYNFAAPVYHRMLGALGRGDWAAARAEQLRSARIVQVLARHGYLGASKALMRRLGVPVGPVRLPLSNPSTDAESALLAELGKAGWTPSGC